MAVRNLRDIEAIEAVPLQQHALPRSTFDVFRTQASVMPTARALSFFLDVGHITRPYAWNFRELYEDICRTANVFGSLGVTSHDVVAFVLPNLPETHFVIWGGEAAGIPMAINPLQNGAQIAELVNAASAKVLVCLAPTPGTDIWPKLAEHLNSMRSVETIVWVSLRPYVSVAKRVVLAYGEWKARRGVHGRRIVDLHECMARQPHDRLTSSRKIEPTDASSYFCTGGTTGRPKIAIRTHGCEVFDAWAVGKVQARDQTATTIFCGLPLFHVNGQLVTGLMAWMRGHHVVLGTPQGYRGKDVIARFWNIVEAFRINAFSGVPTLFAALLQQAVEGRDISSLEYAACGAAPMPTELARSFETTTGIRIVEGYGLTEGACVSSTNPLDGERRVGSIGLRLPYQQMAAVILDDDGAYARMADVDEVGVIAIHGPNVFHGYLDPLHNEGLWIDIGGQRWLNTGDLGRCDTDGYFWLIGRKKELIIRGGHNIDPRTIEDALLRHPAVALAAAIGRPDAHAGEVPVAYVQLKDTASASADDLLQFAARNIGERAAVPKHVRILGAVPTTAVGKIFKPALLEREIESVVRACADELGVTLDRLCVSQDTRRGYFARIAMRGPAREFAAMLGQYTFSVEWEDETVLHA